jgi:hypothetical protein
LSQQVSKLTLADEIKELMLDRHGNTSKGKLSIVEIQNPEGIKRVYY